ncbi:MAG: citramalate synthase [Candidatus Magnetoovum sp. WYHC-5]|nr:citramalate synthase [Candidatus Magnetoovum sp. WYHC-5]
MRKIEIFDTTLRDGSQAEDVSMSVEDKLRITEKLDELGVHYIEGGWPGSNPKDALYFEKVKTLKLKNAKIVVFGSTIRKGNTVHNDPNMQSLLKAETSIITMFGKTWDMQVTDALKISIEENLDLIHDSISFCKHNVDKVFFDAEHYFDGYKSNPPYAIKCIQAADEAGADCIVLCDTNGGCLPDDIKRITTETKKSVNTHIGIHVHNDSDCAVANSIIAVENGAVHVQGTINGIGERCGNANLCSIIPNLELKLGYKCIGRERLRLIREVSRFVNEIINIPHNKKQPYTGDSAFAHKGGMHVNAVQKRTDTYEHVNPELVGNSRRILISDLAGKSNILRKAEEFGMSLDKDKKVAELLEKLKELESKGYQFEGAEASFELLMKKEMGQYEETFELLDLKVITEKQTHDNSFVSDVMIKAQFPDGTQIHTAASGNGPVNAIDNALKKVMMRYYPQIENVVLHDYKVRVLSAGKGTATGVRVLIESGDGKHRWATVGFSENVIEASWEALLDSYEYKILKKY